MAIETAIETVDENTGPTAEHVIRCAACNGEHVVGNYNDEGLWYGYCLTCGCSFWDRLGT